MSIFSAPQPENRGAPVKVTGFRRQQSHAPQGDPCGVCGQPANAHRVRRKAERDAKPPRRSGRSKKKSPYEAEFYGIDGEGIGKDPHLYTLIACTNESDTDRHYLEAGEGLRTQAILDWLLSLPQNRMIFAYAFNYDLTKILQDIDDKTLYFLFHPELRNRKGRDAAKGPKPVFWKGFGLNLQGSKFGIFKGKRKIIIWDIFKFFQGKFVGALKDWKVGTPELWERMGEMKDLRDVFTEEMKERIRNYCLEECKCMAELARKLYKGHTDAGLELTSFYGAGSSASAMLSKMGIKDVIVDPPQEMKEPVAASFFGGRFENSVIGEIEGPVYNYDISSAYPYQLYRLPCLLHARWKKTNRRADLDTARTALVRCSLLASPVIEHWAPFPFRDKKGTISYPRVIDSCWVWLDEYKQGELGWPNNVVFLEAWIYESDCDCHPFKDIPHYYNERCRIGKEGPGIVMKLGSNSCYGKIAQSVGNGVFNSWVWAGMITSGCRAQLLEVLLLHKDRSNLLMAATDGAFTREPLITPTPIETGTSGTGKPLGGWEEKKITQNVFIARPGIYFPMNPSEKQLKECKGRGVGKTVVYKNWELITDSWKQYRDTQPVTVANVRRFCGALTSIRRNEQADGTFKYIRANGHNGLPDENEKNWPKYGEWVEREVKMSFDPRPKRERVLEDGVSLELRDSQGDSIPYSKAMKNVESDAMGEGYKIMIEQPDCDMEEVT